MTQHDLLARIVAAWDEPLSADDHSGIVMDALIAEARDVLVHAKHSKDAVCPACSNDVPYHMADCRCGHRPWCVPHPSDGIHQWRSMCRLPHDHVQAPELRADLVRGLGMTAESEWPIAEPESLSDVLMDLRVESPYAAAVMTYQDASRDLARRIVRNLRLSPEDDR